MNDVKVTVVVVPRERFSMAKRNLESILAATSAQFKMIYVDGGSPPALRRYLERASAQYQFRLLRYNCYLSPNEARNIGFAEVTTPYTIFIDNDVMVAPRWLDHLVTCAEETNAWLVGPLYCQGEPVHEIIHMAGGDAFLEENSEGRWLYEVHRYVGEPLAHVRHRLRREPTQVVEFHTLLVQSAALRRLGPLDERLMCTREHLDLCMRVRAAGGEIYLEPSAVITAIQPPPITWTDLPYYLLRWSDEWTQATYRCLNETWGAADGDNVDLRRRIRGYRNQALPTVRAAAAAIFGISIAERFNAGLDKWLTLGARRIRKKTLKRRPALTPPQVRYSVKS